MANKKLKEIKKEDIEKYQDGTLKFNELCTMYGVSVPTMYKFFDENNISRRLNLVKESIKHDFFNNIDTEEKAYIFGFYTADGCVCKGNTKQGYTFQISISALDIKLVEKIRDILSPNANVTTSSPRINNFGIKTNSMCNLVIHSKELVNKLDGIGFGVNKTYLEKSVKNIIPQELMFHFIRGYFDGDGCISTSNSKKKHTLISGEETLYENRTYNFNIISKDHKLISEVAEFLELNNFKISYSNDKGCLTISIHRKKEILEMYNNLYNNSSIYLERKYLKFREILEIPC